jgi:hypothetical protein
MNWCKKYLIFNTVIRAMPSSSSGFLYIKNQLKEHSYPQTAALSLSGIISSSCDFVHLAQKNFKK